MATYTTGTYTLSGVLFPVTAETLANQVVTYNLGGVIDTFNIQSDTGATTTINQTVSVLDTINLTAAGGSIVLGTGIAGIDTVNTTLTSGGSVVVSAAQAGLLSGGSFTYGTGGGTIVTGTAGTSAAVTLASTVKGLTSAADHIDDRSLSFANITGYSVTGTGTGTQTVTITDGSGNFSFTTNAANLTVGTYTAANLNTGTLKFTADGTGGTSLTVCFLRGTRVATPDGETAVEDLRPGALVAVRRDGATAFEPVRWVGSGRMNAARQIEDFPVRVRAGAFEHNVPHRDLLVTSEHCLFVDGKLIPARMLVNGRSITVDTAVTEYEYFHVELEAHAILVAEGLEAESYLDTGNRGNFLNSAVPSLRPDFTVDPANKSWAQDAAAPLAVDRDTVEPIWKKLEARAIALGVAAGAVQARMVDEPDLRLVTETGLEIEPTLFDGRFCAFVVPGNVGTVHLKSRTARPSEIVGPFLDDRRELGVLVGRIGISEGRRRVMSTAHLAEAALSGWHGLEHQASCRWTNGCALIPVDLSWSEGRPVFLDIEVVDAGPYLTAALAA